MNHCRTSYMVVRRERRRPSLASRMIGPLVVLLAVAVWPAAVFAADATADRPSNAIVVFVVILLLLGSITAGLFFASPFRKRLTSSATEPEVVADGLDARIQRSLYSPPTAVLPTPARPPLLAQPTPVHQPPLPAQLSPVPRQTAYQAAPVQQRAPVQPTRIQPQPAAQPRPIGSPWSTSNPQPDRNWQPRRRVTPST